MFFVSGTMISVVFTTIGKQNTRSKAQVWNFFEELLNGFYPLPKLANSQVQQFDEYNPRMIMIRAITMFSMATILLPINLKKELSSLRYLSAGILLIILFTILVSLCRLMAKIGRCFPGSPVLRVLLHHEDLQVRVLQHGFQFELVLRDLYYPVLLQLPSKLFLYQSGDEIEDHKKG